MQIWWEIMGAIGNKPIVYGTINPLYIRIYRVKKVSQQINRWFVRE